MMRAVNLRLFQGCGALEPQRPPRNLHEVQVVQLPLHIGRRLVSLLRIPLERVEDDLLQRGVQLRFARLGASGSPVTRAFMTT